MLFASVANASTFMPPEGTKIAHQVDVLYAFLLIVSFISCALVIGGFVYFGIKYRRKAEGQYGEWITHHNVLEFLWSFIPFVIFMIVFVWGWIVYSGLRTMPKDALEIAVQGQKWSWTFLYKSGKTTSAEFYVPVDTDVKLIMTSKDVIHSMYIPAFRQKQDVIPGRYTATWFHADKIGDFQIFCAEYCGDNHSGMLAKVHVVSRAKYESWLAEDPYKNLTLEQVGQRIYQTRCFICHTTDGTIQNPTSSGPSWKGIWHKMETMEDGATVDIDENYIRESINTPNAKIVKGFKPGMPSFAGQLSEKELLGVIEYIKSVK
jgi:cytochrome c oxidase subunit 2